MAVTIAINNFMKCFIFCMIVIVTVVSLYYPLYYFWSLKYFQHFRSLTYMEKSPDLKYILIWTSPTTDPIKYLGKGTNTFITRNCSYNNCYVTSDRQLLKDVSEFDVILFHGPELKNEASFKPQFRSPRQKYVYASMESSAYYPVCNQMFNSFFNWTWTYKFNSDINYGYLSVRDKEGIVIGPKEEMHWEKLEDMMPINGTLKEKLSMKKIAAAWFVSNCGAPSGRDLVGKQLQSELAKYNMQVDIFGRCGTKKCPVSSMRECLKKLETDYYFYLSFENSFAEDYVTEKLLNGLNHYAVPVVYGGANYTRFMPDGMYLSAQKLSVSEVAKEIANAVENKQKYYDFFKWHNQYSYHGVEEYNDTDPFCNFCESVNNEELFSRTSVYEDFIQWWNPRNFTCSNASIAVHSILLNVLVFMLLPMWSQ